MDAFHSLASFTRESAVDPFDPQAYGRQFKLLLETNRCRPLGSGQSVDSMRAPLRELTVDSAFADQPLTGHNIVNRAMAECCVSGVWLLYDYLDESHKISQNIDTPDGSFWHAIMHRREGDFSNAKYWFRRVGDHPTFAALAQRAATIAEDDPQTDAVDQLAAGGPWDPYAFVDLCERVENGLPDVRQECELIQQAEWELLFDHCYWSAVG
jgi:hypothetical protein